MRKNPFILYLLIGSVLSVFIIAAYITNSRSQVPVSFAQETVTLREVQHLNRTGISVVLKSGKYTILEFGGRGCIPCRKMQPILSEVEDRFGASINVYNVYLEDDMSLARDFRISLIPTQIVFDTEGKEIMRHVGFWERSALLAKLQNFGII